MRQVSCFLVVVVSLALTCASGCGQKEPEPPPLVKVEGKVVDKSGKPYTNGSKIEFRSTKASADTTVGAIEEDGSFKLRTIVGNKAFDGAQEGPHTVTIIPKLTSQDVQPINLKQPVTIQGETKDLIIKLEK